MQFVSNFVNIEPITKIESWCKKVKIWKGIRCPQIVKQYKKSIGGVDIVKANAVT